MKQPLPSLRPLSCFQCGKDYASRSYFQEHLRAIHSQPHRQKFACFHCPSGQYATKKSLSKHVTTIHLKLRHDLKECFDCQYETRSAHRFISHTVAEHSSTMYIRQAFPKLRCFECNMDFDFFWKLHAHVRDTHNRRRLGRRQFQCFGCGKMIETRRGVVRHVTKELNSELFRQVQCFSCGHRTDMKQSMAKHQALVHDATVFKVFARARQPSECHECGAKLVSKSSILQHVRVVHLKVAKRRLECFKCGRNFPSKDTLSSHCGFAPSEGMACFHCEFAVPSRLGMGRLINHVFQRHLFRWTCRECRLSLSSKNDVNRHLLAFHSQKWPGRRLYVCDDCGTTSAYTYKAGLTAHLTAISHRKRGV